MGSPKDFFESAKNKVLTAYASVSDAIGEKYTSIRKKEEAPKTPLEQMTDDWMSVYKILSQAKQEKKYAERIDLLEQSRSQLEELTRRYPLALPEEQGYAKEYEELWRYTRQLTTKVSTALKQGGDAQDIAKITEEVENDIVRPYEQLQRSRPSERTLIDTIKEQMGKDGKKVAIGGLAAVALYLIKKKM